jgi:dephospho-CoA kinase
MTREQAEARIAAQMSLAEKRRLATDEIDCSGTLEETRRQVTALVTQLKQMAAASQR